MNWKKHQKMINEFLKFINQKSDDFILKGGSALSSCYDSPRISSDIDFDAFDSRFLEYAVEFCDERNIPYNIKKDTQTTKRIMLHYDDVECLPLKIESSFREHKLATHFAQKDENNINRYNINRLAKLKLRAFLNRDRIRDVYDVCFIYDKYKNFLSEETRVDYEDAFIFKTPDDIFYMLDDQEDDQIDSNKLFDDYCRIYEELGTGKLDHIKAELAKADEDESNTDQEIKGDDSYDKD